MKKIALLLLPSIVVSCITIPFGSQLEPFDEQVLIEGDSNKILVIDIEGVLQDQKERGMFSDNKINLTARIKEQFDLARQDNHIKAVVLKIDSPGGGVTTSDIIYHEVMLYKKATGNYIVTQMGTVAASGGYYIAVASDHIAAYPTTITGSIGVIATLFNIKGLLDKIGVEDQTIAAGKSKTMGSIFKKMTANDRKLFKRIIDSMYERFVSIVLQGRPNLDRKKLLEVADGRVLIAADAKEAGLIDSIGYFEDTIELIKQKKSLNNPTIISYIRPDTYKPNAYAQVTVKNQGTINMINLDTSMLMSRYGISFMYLWKP